VTDTDRDLANLRRRCRLAEAWLWRPQFFDPETVERARAEVLQRLDDPDRPATLLVYVNIPLCASSCGYCMFDRYRLRDPEMLERYVAGLVTRLHDHHRRHGQVRASSAHIGGGTPSLLSADQLTRLLGAMQQAFHVAHQFTLESNPSTLGPDQLEAARRHGVNRLSLGVQSLDPDVLRRISRHNPPPQVIGDLVRRSRRLGMLTNVDLMVGLPGQGPETFASDLNRVTRWRPDTITLYRFQPVPRLPQPPGPEMRYNRLLTRPAVLARLLGRRYVFGPHPGGDGSDSQRLHRATSAATLGVARVSLGAALRNVVSPRNRFGFYQCFDDADSQLLGFGPGAYSHLHGLGWFRDVTALDRVEAPVYFGSRVTPAQVASIEFLERLLRDRSLLDPALGGFLGKQDPARWRPSLDHAIAAGTLVRRLGHLRLARDAPADAVMALARELVGPLPERPRDQWESAARMGVDLLEDVQLELIPDTGAEPGSPPAVWRWLKTLQLSRLGDRVGAAELMRVRGQRAEFRLTTSNQSVRVHVAPHRGQACYGHSASFSLSWIPDGDPSPSKTQEAGLEELLRETQRRDGQALS
jgi:coproporphyrinogen III oxidase-like Fe-S oxidoreductase